MWMEGDEFENVVQVGYRCKEGVGTQKKESGSEVAKEMVREVGKMASGFAITKRVAQLSGNKGWWFVAKTRRCLVEVGKKWRYKHWQWQKVKEVVVIF